MLTLQAEGLKYRTLGQSPKKIPFLIFQPVGLIQWNSMSFTTGGKGFYYPFFVPALQAGGIGDL